MSTTVTTEWFQRKAQDQKDRRGQIDGLKPFEYDLHVSFSWQDPDGLTHNDGIRLKKENIGKNYF